MIWKGEKVKDTAYAIMQELFKIEDVNEMRLFVKTYADDVREKMSESDAIENLRFGTSYFAPDQATGVRSRNLLFEAMDYAY